MADIKVFYFQEIRGRGEFIRLLLTAAGVKFEDVRIKMESWGQFDSLTPDTDIKKEAPFGQLPYVIYYGKKLGQSIPMASYLAKKYGLYGSTAEDALKQEEVMHLVEDLRVPHVKGWVYAQEPDKKAEVVRQLSEVLIPRYLGYFEALLKENGDRGYFVGNSVTLADMYLYDFIETLQNIHPEALKNFPLLQKLSDNVKALPSLKGYLADRAKTVV